MIVADRAAGRPAAARPARSLSSDRLHDAANRTCGGTAEAPPLLRVRQRRGESWGCPSCTVVVVGVGVVLVPVPETLAAPVAAVAARSRRCDSLRVDARSRSAEIVVGSGDAVDGQVIAALEGLDLRTSSPGCRCPSSASGSRRSSGPPGASRRRRRSSPSGACGCRTAATPRAPVTRDEEDHGKCRQRESPPSEHRYRVRQDRTLLFRAPTGLAVGLALKELALRRKTCGDSPQEPVRAQQLGSPAPGRAGPSETRLGVLARQYTQILGGRAGMFTTR